MTNRKDRPEPGEAQGALDTIQKMEQAALRRAIPPRWFGAIMALLAGALVALSAADLREYHVYIILFMAFIIVYQTQKTKVSTRLFPSKRTGIALVILVPLFFLLVIAAQAFTDTMGAAWAALSAGIVFALTLYAMSILERRWYHAGIAVEKGK